MNKLLWFLAVLQVSCAYSVPKLAQYESLPSMPKCNPTSVEWFPHPYSCEMFVICFHGNPIEMSCAPKLHFSAEQRKCMLPRLAECDINAFCPEVDDEKNPVFLADKNDCTKYFVCFTGKAIERSCAQGLFFDVKSNWCTFPENVTCDPRTPNAPIITTTTPPPVSTTSMPDPTTLPPVPIDTSICRIIGEYNINGSYVKSMCYHDQENAYGAASLNCQMHGMRLLRVEDSTEQTETLNVLVSMFGSGTFGIYFASGRNIDGSWYHDDNTPIYENMLWNSEGRPSLGCVVVNNVGSMTFDAIPCEYTPHSICEFKRPRA
ncbi:unnamed protein product [Diamesa hyperborea]